MFVRSTTPDTVVVKTSAGVVVDSVTLADDGFGKYEADIAVTALTDYLITFNSEVTYPAIGVGEADGDLVPTYGSLAFVNSYAATRLHTANWDNADTTEKVKRILYATELINSLHFAGNRYYTNQQLPFPRACLSYTPLDISKAMADEAIAVDLDVDQQAIHDSYRVVQRRFAGVSTTYGRDPVPDHRTYGFSSLTAWRLLYPYLAKSDRINIRRSS